MHMLITPVVFFLIAVVSVITACVYFDQMGRFGPRAGLDGICGGFLVLAGFALFGAAYLHVREKP